MTQPEAQMEELLIGQLTHHESQWTTPVQIEMWYRSLFGGAETVVQR